MRSTPFRWRRTCGSVGQAGAGFQGEGGLELWQPVAILAAWTGGRGMPQRVPCSGPAA